jgi:RNA polymerase sigma factor (sigma-70 family)
VGLETSVLTEHFFRLEAGRMVAALVRVLGVRHLALAEDAVQDALVRALETWKFAGAPRNPAAWLMRAARNRATDLLRRQGTGGRLAPALRASLEAEAPEEAVGEAGHAIADDELRLMFSCCDPALSPPSQVAVILKYLCGFSTREVAQAFLASEAAVEKQLFRARTALVERGALFEVRHATEVVERLPSVQRAVYLLFNEGYHGAHARQSVHEDLCHEALRLGVLLARSQATAGPTTWAMLALLCLLAARLKSRVGDDGHLLLLEDQDRRAWDRSLVAEGLRWLSRSAEGQTLSTWHLEAAIAAHHATAETFEATDWAAIRDLYDLLWPAEPTPVVALNRAVAVGMAEGPEAGLRALAGVADRARLLHYPFLPAAEAEFERRAGRPERAAERLREALRLARNPDEAEVLRRKLLACDAAG